MKYKLLKDVIKLLDEFESVSGTHYSMDAGGFKSWINDNLKNKKPQHPTPDWKGFEEGRTPESVIATLLVHLNRYAKTYSKAAMHGSGFSTQDEFIYLINLKAFGSMTKMELIRMNIHDKPAGMQIINRLLGQGWIKQVGSKTDKRSKVISITRDGLQVLDKQMQKIREATNIVSGNLLPQEKMELVRLLTKLEKFHNPIFIRNIETDLLLEIANKEHLFVNS